jgi:hypothetical protein
MARFAKRVNDFVADEGTAAHSLSELCFYNKTWPEHHRGETISVNDKVFTVDDEMIENTQLYVEMTRRYAVPGAIFEVECQLDVPEIGSKGGKVDSMIYNPSADHLFVNDLKYGKGMIIEPTAPQVITYGLGARPHFKGITKNTNVTLCITQPRAPHELGPIRVFDTTMGALEDYMWKYLVPAHEASKNPANLTFNPGPWCNTKFCAGKAQCVAWYNHLVYLLGIPLDKDGCIMKDYDGASMVPRLTTLQMDSLLEFLSSADKVKAQLRADLLVRISKGDDINRCKLVNSSRRVAFSAPKEVVEQTLSIFLPNLEDIYEPRKLKTVADIRKLLGDKKTADAVLAPLTTTTGGTPSIESSGSTKKAVDASVIRSTGQMGAVG